MTPGESGEATPILEPAAEALDTPHDFLTRYHESRSLYEKLADEIAFSLEKRLRQQKVPFAHISKRVKTFESLTEKVQRKHYDAPWREITDIAGVRIVFLYPSTRSRIESTIEKEFKVIEKVDKLADLHEDQFGYGALHYVVGLSDTTSGARYEDLKHLVCEVQVRTVMQDAWAIIDHHLVYKNEASIPSQFKRKLNSISGMCENIDRQFDLLRTEREAYAKEVQEQSTTGENFLKQEMNFETVYAYLREHFPSQPPSEDIEYMNLALHAAQHYGLETLQDIDRSLRRTQNARESMAKIIPTRFSISELTRAIALINPEYREHGWSPAQLEQFRKLQSLVEPN